MPRYTQIFTAALAAVGSVIAQSAVVDLKPNNFDDVVLKSGKPALVEFFAPWCGHCKTLAPIYEELASSFEFAKNEVTIAKVDADAEKSLGQRFGVSGFPTLKWFDGKSDTPEDYKSGRDIESLSAFISEKTGIKAKKAKAAPSAVDMLTDSTFEEKIGGDQDVLVAFTAPWCGHCKTLAPIWENLATDFATESAVLIAKVDCEAPEAKGAAAKAGVKSYPTINYYPKGSTEAIPYTGGRSEADLVSFMNGKAGTFRLPGGSLSNLAGVIPSLDTVVQSLRSGGDAAYTEFTKAVKSAQGTYAEYYAKAGTKAHENAAWVEKEATRLGNLIKKGGLAPEKLDDLTTRYNILERFRATPDEKSEL